MKKIAAIFSATILNLIAFDLYAMPQEGVNKAVIYNDDLQNSYNKYLTNDFVSYIILEDNYSARQNKNKYSNAYALGRLYSNLNLGKNFSVNSYLLLEQNASAIDEDTTGNNKLLKHQNVNISELLLKYQNDNFSLMAGKFIANFGTAWQWNRALWASPASNYKQTDKLGFNAIFKAGDLKKTGKYNFGFAVFTNDRKNLDNPLIGNKSSDNKSDAKPGDTRSLNSYVASLDILFDFAKREKLSYHLAYMSLDVNSNAKTIDANQNARQVGYVFGGNYRYPISDNIDFDQLLEYSLIKNYNGTAGNDQKYLTASLNTNLYQNWNITFLAANFKNIVANFDASNQTQYELSFGYQFDKTRFFDSLLLQVGNKTLKTSSKSFSDKTDSVGVMIRYIKRF